ncbi:hypothetical protein HOE22_06315 [Candidatus Woesearchaeota archaeon]|jgi:hypothetical protein|nr:hypothetical protein [Bacteroidota bacterium]MBT4207942.1 hypothetical protein [Candidatus Woesearchaeota archaeon]MBT5528283.1 hypothetical protein [Cytophagia bacterium]MBT7038482.1 hypothetical protein [Bacteroidota bacterium]
MLADVPFIYILTGIIVIGALIGLTIENKQNNIRESKTNHIQKIFEIQNLKYIAGFNSHLNYENIVCAVTEAKFVFMKQLGQIFGEIPRNSINNIILEDKSTVSQRLTATRLLTLGVFSLAAPKKRKHKEYCVIIDWEDSNLENQNVVIEFSGIACQELAIQFTNKLNHYKKTKNQRLRPDEQKCPFCVEIIKKEAKVCRYCHNELPNY